MEENEQENVVVENPEQEKQDKKTNIIEIATSSALFKYFLGAMIIFGVCFISCIFTFQVLLTQVEVSGLSMQPTINASATNDGKSHLDYVFCIKTNNIDYKDIVIIDESQTGVKIIKRVIGLPGQTVTFERINAEVKPSTVRYRVLVDGKELNEPYIKQESSYTWGVSGTYPYYNMIHDTLESGEPFSVTLGKNEYFVMGDNRNNSVDSRYFGPVSGSDIVGKVVLQVKYGQTLFGAIWNAIF